MKNGIKGIIKGVALLGLAGLLVIIHPVKGTAEIQRDSKSGSQNVKTSWQEFHSVVGKCSMKFPNNPEHFSEKMSVAEEGYELKYDAYVSSMEKKIVFMLLIAQYPDFVDESYAQMSLEGFLNGILTHNPNNQLIFADLSLVNGREALDFFIRSGTVYFKGRAMMVKNSLYLMAMECEMQHYDESDFTHFIESFKLAN
jgi:hypothetical protein